MHCRSEILLITQLFADLSMGKGTTKPKWLDRLLVFCKYKKRTVLCVLYGSGVFPSSEASLKQTE